MLCKPLSLRDFPSSPTKLTVPTGPRCLVQGRRVRDPQRPAVLELGRAGARPPFGIGVGHLLGFFLPGLSNDSDLEDFTFLRFAFSSLQCSFLTRSCLTLYPNLLDLAPSLTFPLLSPW